MSELTPDAYVTMAQFRDHLRNGGTSVENDPDSALELLALESAARAIDKACGRDFGTTDSAATARYFDAFEVTGPDGLRRMVCNTDDFATATGLTVYFDVTGNGAYTGTAITGFRTGPLNAASLGRPFTQLIFDSNVWPPRTRAAVRVTAKWGYGTTVPTTIQNANLLQAARFLKRRDAAFGIAGSPEMGNEMRLLAKLDPDVALMVAAYKRSWGAV